MARYLPAFLIFFFSCTPKFILVERTEQFARSQQVKKIICIDPQVRVLSDDEKIDLAKMDKLNNLLKKEVQRSARKNNINLEIQTLGSQSDASYYYDLLRLKKDLLQANNYQLTPINTPNRPRDNSIRRKVFVYPPLISHDFVNYSQKYGTPYFSYIGLYQKKSFVILYHLIVNTETAETVYREVKSLGSNINSTIMAQAVYDSFSMINRELK